MAISESEFKLCLLYTSAPIGMNDLPDWLRRRFTEKNGENGVVSIFILPGRRGMPTRRPS
jgi:hypothetical protein